MMQRATLVILVCVGLTAGWLRPIASAQTMSALVLKAHGRIQPDVEPYQEIAADTQLTLIGDAQLVFLHYVTCRRVTVSGGTITFSTQTYTMTAGVQPAAEQKVDCPYKVVLQPGGDVAGTVIRGPKLHLPIQPTVVLVGPHAGDFAKVQVTTQDGRPVLTAPLEGRRFQWPQGVEPLKANTEYKLTLLPARERGATITVPVIATTPAGSSRDNAPALVRVE